MVDTVMTNLASHSQLYCYSFVSSLKKGLAAPIIFLACCINQAASDPVCHQQRETGSSTVGPAVY